MNKVTNKLSAPLSQKNLYKCYTQKGLTLIELLVVLGIVGILAGIAVPSFVQQMNQNRLVSNANQLLSVFKFARSEAAKRDREIILNENDGNWEVTLDEVGVDERILQKFSPTSDNISVTNLANLTLSTTGEIVGRNDYLIKDDNTDTTDYCLSILPSGQIFLTKTNTC
jgi:type IV fimbrial biogenesis protein FimT